MGSIETLHALVKEFEERERSARKRALLLTLIPIFLTGALTIFSWYRYSALLQNEHRLENVRAEEQELRRKAEDTRSGLVTAGKDLHAAMMSLHRIEAFIDEEKPALRSAHEKRFLNSLRMLFDDLNVSMAGLATRFPELAFEVPTKRWIVVLSSSNDIRSLTALAGRYAKRLPGAKLAIYKAPNGFYVIAVPGDGTYTTAHNRMAEIKNRRIAQAHLIASSGWGDNLLPGEQTGVTR